MRNLHLSLVAIFVSISLLILGGCLGKGTQEPTRLYMLQPLASSETDTEAGAVDDTFSLRVGPIRLPEYLNRPQIVTRTDENKIQLGGVPYCQSFGERSCYRLRRRAHRGPGPEDDRGHNDPSGEIEQGERADLRHRHA